MKNDSIRFSQLRRILEKIGFSEIRQKKRRRFEHSPSETIFLFRPYRSTDVVFPHDLVQVKSQLDWRGLLTPEDFDSMTKKPA